MVQEFQVVNCFDCKIFQVHVKKKGKKWICKLCGEKQSYIKIYFEGSAVSCRKFVQKSNLIKGLKHEEEQSNFEELERVTPFPSSTTAQVSTKWDKFVPDLVSPIVRSSSEEEENVSMNQSQTKPTRKRKSTNKKFQSKKLKEQSSSNYREI